MNELVYDMKNGYAKAIPAFIGEIIVKTPIEAYE
jgi:hypothetical protein